MNDDHPLFGQCITISDCQNVRGDYQVQSGGIDLCGVNLQNAPLVCCVNPRPVTLNKRISLTSKLMLCN